MLKQIVRKPKIAWSIIVLVFIIFILLLLIGCIPNTNDGYLGRFADQLTNYPVPDNCSVLEHFELLGKLNGNGNGMDFAAVVLLQAGLETTKNDLIEYYSSVDFVPARGKTHTVELVVEPVEQPGFTNGYIEHQEITFQSIMNYEEHRYYAVIIYDGGYSAGFDLRGN